MSLGVPGRNLPAIPGVDFYTQEQWVQPGYPMTGPSFPSPGDIITVIIHYPGGGTAETTVSGMHDRMRRMQRDYVDNRGYSLGYSFVVPTFGGVWEGRGVRLRNAANSGKKVSGNANNWSVSIQLNVTGQDAATEKQARDTSAIIGWLRDLGMQVVIDTHMTIDYTACAGSGIIPQVQSGYFEPERWGYPFDKVEPEPEPEPEPPEPEPEPPAPEPEEDMIIYVASDENDANRKWLAVFASGKVLPLTRGMPDAPPKTDVPSDEYDMLRRETAIDG